MTSRRPSCIEAPETAALIERVPCPISPRYRRVLLKASGEALMGDQGFGIDVSVVDRIASDIAEARELGVEVGRGHRRRQHLPRRRGRFQGRRTASPGDHMGMLATIINSLALRTSLVKLGVDAVVAVGDRHAGTLRELLPAPRHRLHRPGQGGDLCRRHRESLLHHRFGGGLAGS